MSSPNSAYETPTWPTNGSGMPPDLDGAAVRDRISALPPRPATGFWNLPNPAQNQPSAVDPNAPTQSYPAVAPVGQQRPPSQATGYIPPNGQRPPRPAASAFGSSGTYVPPRPAQPTAAGAHASHNYQHELGQRPRRANHIGRTALRAITLAQGARDSLYALSEQVWDILAATGDNWLRATFPTEPSRAGPLQRAFNSLLEHLDGQSPMFQALGWAVVREVMRRGPAQAAPPFAAPTPVAPDLDPIPAMQPENDFDNRVRRAEAYYEGRPLGPGETDEARKRAIRAYATFLLHQHEVADEIDAADAEQAAEKNIADINRRSGYDSVAALLDPRRALGPEAADSHADAVLQGQSYRFRAEVFNTIIDALSADPSKARPTDQAMGIIEQFIAQILASSDGRLQALQQFLRANSHLASGVGVALASAATTLHLSSDQHRQVFAKTALGILKQSAERARSESQ